MRSFHSEEEEILTLSLKAKSLLSLHCPKSEVEDGDVGDGWRGEGCADEAGQLSCNYQPAPGWPDCSRSLQRERWRCRVETCRCKMKGDRQGECVTRGGLDGEPGLQDLCRTRSCEAVDSPGYCAVSGRCCPTAGSGLCHIKWSTKWVHNSCFVEKKAPLHLDGGASGGLERL